MVTEHGVYTAPKLAITPGAYVNSVLSHLDLAVNIDIWEMSSAYFRKTAPTIQYPTWFVFQEPQKTSLFYGFPEVDWSHPGYIRVSPDIPDRIISDPRKHSRSPSRHSLNLTAAWVRDHMEGLEPVPQFTSTCLIALAKGKEAKELLLDYLPKSVSKHGEIVVCTVGWSAKFIPILGEMICRMLESNVDVFNFGKYRIPRGHFAIDTWKPGA